MKAKETRFEKYMKFWYGISGPLDEQKRQVMNRIGNRAFFIFFLGMDAAFLISLVLISFYGTNVAYIFLSGSFFVMLMIVSFYVIFQSKKFKLTDNEIEKNEVSNAKIVPIDTNHLIILVSTGTICQYFLFLFP